MAEKMLKVTLVRSTIGAVPKNKKTIEALGLKKVNKTVELPDNAATQGMLRMVAEEAVDTVQEMEKQLVRDIRDRRLVPELRDRDLKVDRCLYTEDCRREVSLAETPRQSLASTCLHLKCLTMMQ